MTLYWVKSRSDVFATFCLLIENEFFKFSENFVQFLAFNQKDYQIYTKHEIAYKPIKFIKVFPFEFQALICLQNQ